MKTQDHNCRICVVLRTNRLVEEYKQELNQSGYKTLVLTSTNSDHIENEGIRLATMHRVKGLDFDHVIVASVNAGVVPLKISNRTSENLINEERLLKERSLLFVAATRAKKTLLITAYNKPSPFIRIKG